MDIGEISVKTPEKISNATPEKIGNNDKEEPSANSAMDLTDSDDKTKDDIAVKDAIKAVESADSADEKMADSADDRSRDSSEYFPSNESEAESDDSQPDMDIDVQELAEFAPSLGNSVSSFQGRLSPVIPSSLAKSSMIELSAEVLESSQGSKSGDIIVKSLSTKKDENILEENEEKLESQEGALSKQTSFGFTVGKADVENSGHVEVRESLNTENKGEVSEGMDITACTDISASQTEPAALKEKLVIPSADPTKETDVIEIFSSPEPVNNAKFFQKETSVDKDSAEETEDGKEDIREINNLIETKEDTSNAEDSKTVKAGVVVIDFTGDNATVKMEESKRTGDPSEASIEMEEKEDKGHTSEFCALISFNVHWALAKNPFVRLSVTKILTWLISFEVLMMRLVGWLF